MIRIAIVAISIPAGMFMASACTPAAELHFVEAGAGHLPAEFNVQSKDAYPADVDNDGDTDLVIAHEYRSNWLLINDGKGTFRSAGTDLPALDRDSEDVTAADFDGDGDLDLLFANEDDRLDELYINDGTGRFSPPVIAFGGRGQSNAVLAADINGDDTPDILLGNDDGIAIWIGDGTGQFADESAIRIDRQTPTVQDLELGDVDNDGDMDLIVASAQNNALYLSDGKGGFALAAGAIPHRTTSEQTREADFADIDGDGDLDLYFANAAFGGPGDATDRLLINDGAGRYAAADPSRLPSDDGTIMTMDADFADIDNDGDADIIAVGLTLSGGLAPAPIRIFANDGAGTFKLATAEFLGNAAPMIGTDIEITDLNHDGVADIYLARRDGPDRLFFGVRK